VTKLWLNNNNNIGPEGAIVIAEALKDAVKGRSGFQLHL